MKLWGRCAMGACRAEVSSRHRLYRGAAFMGRDFVGGLVHERVGAWVDGWMVVVVWGGEEKAVPRV